MSDDYVAVSIVNYRSSADVEGLLESIASTPGQEHLRICVVDNSEDDVELQRLSAIIDRAANAHVRLVKAPANLGYGRGNNLGIAQLVENYGAPSLVLIANPDTRVEQGSFQELQSAATNGAAIRVAETLGDPASAGLYRLDRATGRSRPIMARAGTSDELIYPKGHFLIVPWASWLKSEGFSPDFFLYGEEIDLVLRLAQDSAAIRSEVCSSLRVSHVGGGSTQSTTDKSLVTYREATRSRFLLYRRQARLRRWLPVLLFTRAIFALALLARLRPQAALSVVRGIQSGLSDTVTPPTLIPLESK